MDNFSTKVFNLCDVRTKVWIRWILMGLRRQSIEPLLATSPSLYMMLGNSSPALLQLIAEDKIPNGRVLVPGCGRGYDVVTLASKKRVVTGILLLT